MPISGGARKLSGLQKQVLALYRTILREAVKKDRQAAQQVSVSELLHGGGDNNHGGSTTTSYARHEFRRQSQAVKRTDFKGIEYRIRKGEKQVKLLRMPGVKVVSGTN